MSIAYFDCFSGVSGDMILGALIDAGMPLAHLKRELKLISIGSYELVCRGKRDFKGTDLKVIAKEEPYHSGYKNLDKTIAQSKLNKSIRERARAIFEKLALAEAKVHGTSIDKVHFHEVGACDSIVDIVGTAIGLDYFGFDEIHASPLPFSRGSIACAHGTLPVPAPATLELIKGIPLEKTSVREELVTPTGAAILITVAQRFGESPLQTVKGVGAGFGDRKIKGRPNMLRLLIGEGFSSLIIEADIDDMNPQIFDHVMKHLFQAGAVDVTLASIQMKKNRPGVRLSCISPWDKKDRLIDIMLSETSTFGVRFWPVERKALIRELKKGKVKKGSITFKVGRDSTGKIIKASPEFEDVRRLAKKQKRAVKDVYAEAAAVAANLVKG
ncbi:MAG: nickel pincer cofactor biosynthesis protein LarC [Pseudomonadota bacterium]